MESTLPNTIVPFNPSVGSGLAGNDGYGITGTPENYQRLGATLNLSRATSLTNLEINNLFAKPTVVAIAQGNSTPTTARYPNTVTNGDFLLRGNSIATVVGDGLDEFTTWTFNLTRDPDFIDLTDTTLLASAELTLTLKPTFGINTDGITIQGLGSIVKPIRELEAGKTDTITIDLLDYFSPDTVVQAIQANGGQLSVTYQDDAIVSFAQLEMSTFDSGIFTVGETGEIAIDFLFDGGMYRGELALFSLEGLGQYKPGSEAFIEEATRRALTNSELGHVVISDRAEGARFSGALPHEEDFNAGKYSGVKAFDLRAGDRFGFMLIPNGWTSEVFETPGIDGSKRPLFSMATTGSNSDFNFEYLVDISGDGNTFAWEDLRAPKSDFDFNDIIFQVKGATGTVIQLDEVLEPDVDWRNSEVGQRLMQFVVDPLDPMGNTPNQALRAAPSTTGRKYRGWVGSIDPVDYYSLSLGMRNQFNLNLRGLSADANVQVLDLDGNVVYSATNAGKAAESISGFLEAGAYRVRVLSVGNTGTAYNLTLAVRPTIAGITTTGSEAGGYSAVGQSIPLINVDRFRSGNPSLGSDPRFSGIDGSGFSTVILDTGLDLNSPVFKDKIAFQFDFGEDDGNATDPDPVDEKEKDVKHGSIVSSIVTSVAPGTKIIHLKVFPDYISYIGDQFKWKDVEQALQWVLVNAERYRISSINMSFSDGGNWNPDSSNSNYSYKNLEEFYKGEKIGIHDELEALSKRGVINIAASGNGYNQYSEIQGVSYPSADPNVLSIGAVFDADIGPYEPIITISDPIKGDKEIPDERIAFSTAADRIAPFSQRHEKLTTVFAPGALIDTPGSFGDDTIALKSGTSFAAPHIAGMAALAQQLARQELNRQLTPTEFRQLLINTGTPIFDGDDEDDDVPNTKREFRRADMLTLAQGILNLRPPYDRDIDLSGTLFDVVQEPLGTGDFFDVNFQIQNTGLDNAGSFDVNFYLSENGEITQNDYFLGSTQVDGLNGRNNSGGTAQLVLPDRSNPIWQGFIGGSGYIGMIVDGSNTVGETNEFNNLNIGLLRDYDDVLIGNVPTYRSGVLTLAVERVRAIDNLDKGRLIRRRREADFYAFLSIDGSWQPTSIIENNNDIDVRFNPNWQNSLFLDAKTLNGRTTIPLNIQVWESDGTTDDEYVDVNWQPDRRDIYLVYNLETGEISGDLTGRDGELLYSFGAGDSNRGEIWFTANFTPIT